MGHMVYDCPRCDYSTDSQSGFAIHIGKSHDSHWLVELHGEDKILEMYADMSQSEMAREFDVTTKVVTKALEEIDADIRSRSESMIKYYEDHGRNPANTPKPPYLTHHDQGYEEIRHQRQRIYVHRLAAVAWFGFDAVGGHHVHHKNNIPWDNREENLAVKTASEHRSHHTQEMWDKGYGVAERE